MASKFPVIRRLLKKAVELNVPWRDAASVILVAKRQPKMDRRDLSIATPDHGDGRDLSDEVELLHPDDAQYLAKYERTDDAFKRILAEGQADVNSQPSARGLGDCAKRRDFCVLMVKRPASDRFWPGALVFPTGAFIDSADNYKFWIQWYAKYVAACGGGKFASAEEIMDHVDSLQNLPGPRPPSFQKFWSERITQADASYLEIEPHMPAEIAFRICALRVLFAGAGILPVKNLDNNMDVVYHHDTDHDAYTWIMATAEIGTMSTVHRLKKDVRGFQADLLCHGPQFFHDWISSSDASAAFFPNVRAIMEWSNWLTPTAYPNRARFDTMVYVGFVDHLVPAHVADTGEFSNAEWADPEQILDDALAGRHILPAPEFYELSRLANFTSFEQLKKFAENRERRGIERYCPRMCLSADGKGLCLLPGDDLYLMSESDIIQESATPTVLQESALALRKMARNLNRLECEPGGTGLAWHQCKLYANAEPSCGHVTPVQAE